MSVFSADEVRVLEAISELAYGNPFLPARIAAEETALGADFVPVQAVWSARLDGDGNTPNVRRIGALAEELVSRLRGRLTAGQRPTVRERELYRDLALYVIYYRHEAKLLELILRARRGEDGCSAPFFKAFVKDVAEVLTVPGQTEAPSDAAVAHLFACCFQVRRAFAHTFNLIIGSSMAAARLRAAVWQSVFTHDMRRYRTVLHDRMRDIAVLITGPSGTGKELVARAIGMSSYIPFDPATGRFEADFRDQFHPLNLSALSPSLIESELFGHCRGAYTGAQTDRVGWFETCAGAGTVFLDEIGDVEPAIQVKLLRVLETRAFQRLGETTPRAFRGKLAAATHRDLARAIEAGRFREDLFFRLCSDMIRTPSLSEQIQESPADLETLVAFLARRLIGEEAAPALTAEVMDWIGRELSPGYPWPGNVRELDQCVRNILVRQEYRPQQRGGDDAFFADFSGGRLTAEEVLRRYCTQVYALTRNYQETARRLQLDHRTVKARIDADLLRQLTGEDRPG